MNPLETEIIVLLAKNETADLCVPYVRRRIAKDIFDMIKTNWNKSGLSDVYKNNCLKCEKDKNKMVELITMHDEDRKMSWASCPDCGSEYDAGDLYTGE